MRAILTIGAVMAMLAPAAMAQTAETAVICNPKVSIANVRAGPGAKNFALVDTLPNKTPIKVLERTMNQEAGREWARIEFKSTKTGKTETAYVDSISVVKECAQTAGPPITSPAPAGTGDAAANQPAQSRQQATPLKLLSSLAMSDAPRAVAYRDDKTIVMSAEAAIVTFDDVGLFEKSRFKIDAKERVRLSEDGRYAVTTTTSGISLYDLEKQTRIADRYFAAAADIRQARWRPDGSVVILHRDSRYSGSGMCVWRANPQIFNCGSAPGDSEDLAVTRDGAQIAFAAGGITSAAGDDPHNFKWGNVDPKGSSKYASKVAVCPDGRCVVFAGPGAIIERVSLPEKKAATLRSLEGEGGTPAVAIFTRDGSKFAVLTTNGSIQLRDATSGKLLQNGSAGDYVYAAAFSPDGSKLAVSSSGKLQIWGVGDENAMAAAASLREQAQRQTRVLIDERKQRLDAFNCDAVRDLDGKIGDAPQYAKCVAAKATSERAEAMKRLDCDAVRDLDGKASGEKQHAQCVFEKIQKAGTAREVYQKAVDYDLAKDRVKAKKLYQTLRERFPNDDLAIEAAKRLTAMNDVESTEAASERAAAAASSAADRATAAQRENREAIERSNRDAAYQQQRQIADQRQREYQACISRKVACDNSCDGYRDTSARIRCRSGCVYCQSP